CVRVTRLRQVPVKSQFYAPYRKQDEKPRYRTEAQFSDDQAALKNWPKNASKGKNMTLYERQNVI
ncbi:MAG: hypothetical protein K2O74_02710, partial [Eubacteriales bacterium]|nr:hypothetical protein [Eubacteriales bacterium]